MRPVVRLLAPYALVAGVALATWIDLARPFASGGAHVEANAMVTRLAFPRVVGSDALGRALDDVEAELRAATARVPGATVERLTGWRKSDSLYYGTPMFLFSTALVARVPGTEQDGGADIVFSAHLDSVTHAPGVGDDLAGVASVVDAIRFASTTRRKGDVAAIISAQEEGCVTCAAQLVAAKPSSSAAGTEARPTQGTRPLRADIVVVMDESGNAPPIAAFDAMRDDAALTHSDGLVAASRSAFGWTLVSDIVHALSLGVGRTEMADLATRLGGDREGTRFTDRTTPVSGIAIGAMRGQRIYHTPCDDLAHAHPALVDDLVDVAHEVVALADERPELARRDVLAFRVPFVGTVAVPRVVWMVLSVASFAALVVATLRRPRKRDVAVGAVLAIVSSILAGVVASFSGVGADGLLTMARVGAVQCVALLVASAALTMTLRALVARADPVGFVVGAFVVVVLPVLLAMMTFVSLSGFLTLVCAIGVAIAPLALRRTTSALMRAIACVPLVVMTTQLATILGANWWTLGHGSTGAPFVALTGALLAGTVFVVIEDDRRVPALWPLNVFVVAAGIALFAPIVVKNTADNECPAPVIIDYVDDTDDSASPVLALAAPTLTNIAEAEIDTPDARTAMWVEEAMESSAGFATTFLDEGEETRLVRKLVDIRIPPPRITLVGIEDRAKDRVWTVHVEPAQETGTITLEPHEAKDASPGDKPRGSTSRWRSFGILEAEAVALPLDDKPLRVMLRATPKSGVDVVIATSLETAVLHVQATENGPLPTGLLPEMKGRASPSSGPPQTPRASPITFVRTHVELKHSAAP